MHWLWEAHSPGGRVAAVDDADWLDDDETLSGDEATVGTGVLAVAQVGQAPSTASLK